MEVKYIEEIQGAYEKYVESVKYQSPHTPNGDCTSDCGHTEDCPVMPFGDWLDEVCTELRS